MTDFTGLDIAGRIATPNDSDWDQARAACIVANHAVSLGEV
jgi:hypothetical protein